MPHSIAFSAMIASPTGRGVILIGGHMEYPSGSHRDCCCNDFFDGIPNCPDGLTSKKLIELSGNSESTLKWSTMEQTLDCGGIDTIAIPISNEVYNNLEELRQKSTLCFNNPPPVPDYELEQPEGENPFNPSIKKCLLFWVSLVALVFATPMLLVAGILGILRLIFSPYALNADIL